jgi:hypothetical protein
MPVLSNNGRLISSLPITSTVRGQDELLLQSNGVTKRISYAALSSSILSSTNFSPFNATVNFTSTNNKFTGSFYNPDFKSSNFYTVAVRNTLTGNTIIATSGFSGNVTGNITSTGTSTFSSIDVNGGAIDGTSIGNSSESTIKGTRISASIGFRGNITSIGTSTFSNIDVNGGTIDGTIIGASSAAAVTGTTITANTGFVGNLTGNLTGDVYNSTTTKVLESGNTTTTPNGGVSSAYFYGTSSYATQALTAAYAAAGGSAINGIPSLGNQYQVLAKNTNTSYDVGWTNPITASNVGIADYLTIWDGARTLKNLNNFYWDGVNTYVIQTQLQVDQGIKSNGGFTGSFVGNSQTVNVTVASPYKIIYGNNNSSVKLKLSASAYCTMSLLKGQTSNVFVHNSGKFKVLKWSGSLDGGSTANTKIYWKNGLSASITMATGSKDVITFVNIDDKIFGSAINNFQ